MKSSLRFLYLFVWLAGFIYIDASAQENPQNEEALKFHSLYSLDLTDTYYTKSVKINTDQEYTGLSLDVPEHIDISQISVLMESGEEVVLQHDDHVQVHGKHRSQLVLFKAATSFSLIFKKKVNAFLDFNLVYAPPIFNSSKKDKASNDCSEPSSISFTEWRTGLPPPSVVPNPTSANHIVVHHTATPNSVTDYNQAIRSIYLHHTQTNGWDDIGYNYMVMPNGDIYLGRDPQGAATQDNIQGAHFCAKNRNTLGVAVLGNFTSELPTDTAVESLIKLLAWKVNKESFYPFDSLLHPVGDPNAIYIGRILGHREGCSTVCPGDMFGPEIESIRVEVNDAIQGCVAGLASFSMEGFKIYPNPVSRSEYLNIDSIEHYDLLTIYDLEGRMIERHELTINNTKITLKGLKPGFYIAKISKENIEKSIKLFVQ